jgi:Aspartate/tyrosine/aromatic aminotransferase
MSEINWFPDLQKWFSCIDRDYGSLDRFRDGDTLKEMLRRCENTIAMHKQVFADLAAYPEEKAKWEAEHEGEQAQILEWRDQLAARLAADNVPRIEPSDMSSEATP